MRIGIRIAMVCVISGALFCARPNTAQAGAAKEIILTSTYGVLAGGIVGLATLAFVGSPADNLRNIAMGASIGLYCGIGLGFYIAYGLPAMQEDEEKEKKDVPLDEGGLLDESKPGEMEDGKLPKEAPKDAPDLKDQGKDRDQESKIEWALPQVAVAPMTSTNGSTGWLVYSSLVNVRF